MTRTGMPGIEILQAGSRTIQARGRRSTVFNVVAVAVTASMAYGGCSSRNPGTESGKSPGRGSAGSAEVSIGRQLEDAEAKFAREARSKEYLTSSDFGYYQFEKHWLPEDIFTDAGLIELAKGIERGDTAEIDRVLTGGVKLEGRGRDETTPLGRSLIKQNKQAYRHLLEKGADPNHRIFNLLPIIYIVAGDPVDSEWLALALKHGGDPNIVKKDHTSPYGWETPLFPAIRSRRLSSVELLIEAKADLDHRKYDSSTPLLEAVNVVHFDSAYKLLQAGADFKAENKYGETFVFDVVYHLLPAEHEQWPWQVRCMEYLEGKGVDLEDFAKRHHKSVMLERWTIAKNRRAEKSK